MLYLAHALRTRTAFVAGVAIMNFMFAVTAHAADQKVIDLVAAAPGGAHLIENNPKGLVEISRDEPISWLACPHWDNSVTFVPFDKIEWGDARTAKVVCNDGKLFSVRQKLQKQK